MKTGAVNANGKVTFRVKDRNGKAFTKYIARVMPTDATKGDTTNKRKIR